MGVLEMNIGELKELISGYPDDTLVVIAPSHSYSPCAGGEISNYVAENSWSGEIYDDDDVAGIEEISGEEAEDAMVLWPTN
jgi:hypothetical protein